jgi:hypothetical protein
MPSRKLSVDQRRALTVLADSSDGCTEAILLAHGFKLALLVELVRDGSTSATRNRVRAGTRMLDVTRVRITEAGRKALPRARRK